MRDILLFDLDGTLTDPKEGITLSVQYALVTGGIDAPDPDALCCFIGPPLKEQFMDYAGWNDQEGEAAVARYRERFGTVGWAKNKVYDGMHDLLAALREAGFTLAVATSKPFVYAEQILRHFGLLDYFHVAVGSELDGTRTDKAEVIEETLRQLGQPDRSRVLMIGDRRHDVEGAAKCGVPCVGVRYGFAAEGELEAAGACHVADSVEALRDYLLAQ